MAIRMCWVLCKRIIGICPKVKDLFTVFACSQYTLNICICYCTQNKRKKRRTLGILQERSANILYITQLLIFKSRCRAANVGVNSCTVSWCFHSKVRRNHFLCIDQLFLLLHMHHQKHLKGTWESEMHFEISPDLTPPLLFQMEFQNHIKVKPLSLWADGQNK